MKAKKYHIGILSLAVSIPYMTSYPATDDTAFKEICTVSHNGKKVYTMFENEVNNGVYVVQEHLVGKLEEVDKLNDRISFLFSGRVKIYVSHTIWNTNDLDNEPVILECDVKELPVAFDWDDWESRLWPVADANATSAFQKLAKIEASQKTVRIAIHQIQPVFNERGDLVSLEGTLPAVLE